jgi:meso-butanediol dehydrogenase / (S,S)-butanediol dehydrogenase / diacetyl reductase
MRLDGKVALITGGGSGIGAAIAECFVSEGAKVCITGRRGEALEAVASLLPSGTVATCQGDVSRDADVTRMITASIEFGGKLDILVNNAGIGEGGGIVGADRARWRQILDVNLTGPFMLMQEAIPHMIANNGGSIVNVSSLAGVRSLPHAAAYSASKAGLIMLTKQTALDLGPHNIRCNAVCPGPVHTPMMDADLREACRTLDCDLDTYLPSICAVLPLRRCAQPREIADACVFLASDSASFITGVALLVDGGTAVIDAFGAAVEASLQPGGET